MVSQVSGYQLKQLAAHVVGTEGSQVVLKIQRRSSDEVYQVTLTRG